MKLATVTLGEDLLEEVVRVSGEESPAQAVSHSLVEYLQRHRARRILELAGSGLWGGNLAEMRDDRQQADEVTSNGALPGSAEVRREGPMASRRDP